MNDHPSDKPINPFAAPASSSVIASTAGDVGLPPPPKLPAVFLKWLVVCTFAAAPSFFLASGLANGRLSANLGMIAGVLMFVIAYTAVEFTDVVQNQMAKPASRRSAWIAYVTRMGISVVFPVGFMVDMFCGMFAVSVSSSLTGLPEPLGTGAEGTDAMIVFCQFLFTTVLQGVLLNLVLFAYMALVWVICKASSSN